MAAIISNAGISFWPIIVLPNLDPEEVRQEDRRYFATEALRWIPYEFLIGRAQGLAKVDSKISLDDINKAIDKSLWDRQGNMLASWNLLSMRTIP